MAGTAGSFGRVGSSVGKSTDSLAAAAGSSAKGLGGMTSLEKVRYKGLTSAEQKAVKSLPAEASIVGKNKTGWFRDENGKLKYGTIAATAVVVGGVTMSLACAASEKCRKDIADKAAAAAAAPFSGLLTVFKTILGSPLFLGVLLLLCSSSSLSALIALSKYTS